MTLQTMTVPLLLIAYKNVLDWPRGRAKRGPRCH
jgi:hypothetical protein